MAPRRKCECGTCRLCKDRVRAAERLKDPAVREANRVRAAEWYAKNKTRVLAEARERYAVDPEFRAQRLANAQRSCENNPDIARLAKRKWKDKSRGVPMELDAVAMLPYLWRDPCAYCGAPAEGVDHIVPVAAGGDGFASNLTAACHSCNSSKYTDSLLHFLLRRGSEPEVKAA